MVNAKTNINLKANVDDKEVKRAQREFRTLQRDVNKVSRAFKDVLQASVAVGAGLLVVAPRIASAFAKPIKAAGDLQFELDGARAILRSQFDTVDDLDQAFGKLEGQIKELGQTTEFTATQAAVAVQNFARAGFEVDEIYSALPATLSLASATGIELAEAASIAATTLRASGRPAAEFENIVDLLTNTVNNANFTITDLAETFKTAIPRANDAGVSLEDLATAAGLLAEDGLRGTIAATNLQNVIQRLVAPTSESTKALARLGLTFDNFKDSEGDFIGIRDSVVVLDKALKNVRGTAERAELLTEIFGKQGASGASILIRAGADEFDRLRDIVDKTGTAAEIQEIRLDNLTGAIIRLSSAVEAFLINGGEPFLELAQDVIETITGWVSSLSTLVAQNPELTKVLGIGAAAVAAFTAVVIALVGAIGLLLVTKGAWLKILAVLGTRLPLVAGAVKLLGVAVRSLFKIFAGFAIIVTVVEFLAQAVTGLSIFTFKLRELGTIIVNSVLSPFVSLASTLSSLLGTIIEFFGGGEDNFASSLSKRLDALNAELEAEKQAVIQAAADRVFAEEQAIAAAGGGRSVLDARKRAQEEKNAAIEAKKQEEIEKARIEREARARKKREQQEEAQFDAEIRQEAIEIQKKDIAELEKFTVDSSKRINALFRERKLLAELEFEGDPEGLARQLENITRQREQQLERLRRQQEQNIQDLRDLRIRTIEDEFEREEQLFRARQQRELQQFQARGASPQQVEEFERLQQQQLNQLIVRQFEEVFRQRDRIDNFLLEANQRLIDDRLEQERKGLEIAQRQELDDFKRLLDNKSQLSEEDKNNRIAQLEEIQRKERENLAEEQQREQRRNDLGLERTRLDIELGRTDDPLEQIRLQAELELNEFKSLQDRKLEELERFGASEQELEEARQQFKRDLAEQELQIERQKIDQELALRASQIAGAQGVAQTLLDLSKGNSKELFAITKGLAIAEATINVARAISNSIGSGNFIGSAIAGAEAAAQLASIIATTLNFNQGGFVPGNDAVNRDSVPAMLTPGEAVIPQPVVRAFGRDFFQGIIRGTVSPDIANNVKGKGISRISYKPGYQTGGIVSSDLPSAEQAAPKILIENRVTEDTTLAALDSRAGFEVIKNIIQNNREELLGE